MQTSATFSCTPFDDAHSNGVIKGKYVCAGKQENPGTAGSTPTSTGSSSSSTSSGKGAAGRGFEVNVPAMVGIVSVVAGLLHLTL